MTRWLRRLGYALAGLIGLALAAVVVLVILLERGSLNDVINRQATEALGREVRLEGPIDVGLGWQPVLALGPLTLGNPSHVPGEPLLRLARAEVAVGLADLVRGQVTLPRIIVDRPRARLVRLADGRTNWDFGGGQPAGPASDEPLRLPRIGHLELRDVEIDLEDAVGGRNLRATITAQLSPSDDRSRLVADLAVREGGASDPAPAQTLHLEGLIDDPTAPQEGFELTATSRGAGAHRLLELAGLPVEGELPGLTLDLEAARAGGTWQLRSLEARLGDARIAGNGSLRDIAALDGLSFDLDADLPDVESLMQALGLGRRPVPALVLRARGRREGQRNNVTVEGTLGEDELRLEAGTEGPIAELRGLVIEARAGGSQLGKLLPLFGMTEKTVPAYRLDGHVAREGAGAARVDLEAALGRTTFDIAGLIGDIETFRALDLDVGIRGRDPSDILDIFGLPEISLPPYDITGHLAREGDTFRVRGLDGRVGNSDLAGDTSVDLAAEPTAVVADLTSNRLDFDDLAGLLGLPPSTEPGEVASEEQQAGAQAQEASARLLPDVPIDAKAWRTLDLDVRYRGRSVNAPRLPLENLAFHVVTREGWLTLDPLEAETAGGRLVAYASLDGSGGPVDGDFDIRVHDLQLNEFLARFGFTNDVFGVFGGRAELTGQGASLRDLAATADGRIGLTMEGGYVHRLVPELAGLDIGQSIGNYLRDRFGTETEADNRQAIRCAIADFAVQDGIMDARTVLFDMPEDKLTLDGSIDLRQEVLDLMLRAYPRDASFASARMPISIEGPIKSPSIAPAPGGVENETLGWILAPLKALVPFVELGAEDDRPCAGVVDRVEDATRVR